MLLVWGACLILQNMPASVPLLSPVWRLASQNPPPETLAAALTYQVCVGKIQGSLCLSFCQSTRPSVHPPILICPACLTYVRSSQWTQQETRTGLISPPPPPAGALTPVTDSPSSPSRYCSHSQVSNSQVSPSVKYCGSDCLPVL